MSLSNLLQENNYKLYCNSITAKNDTEETIIRNVRVYSNTNVDIFGTSTQLKIQIHNGICTLSTSTTPTVNIPSNANYTLLYMAESPGGYVSIPCPDTIGEKLFFQTNAVTQGDIVRSAYVELDCNYGGTETQGRIFISLVPGVTVSGVSPNFTYTQVAGSTLYNNRCGLLGWSISYPVKQN
jgi:hypothetical protein